MARRLRNRRRAVVRQSPVPSARPRSGVPQPQIGSSRNRRIAALLAGVFATGLGLLGAGRPTIWYDEAVTLNLLHRPFGDTWPVLREVDAVHGIYYMVLRGWTWFTGDSIEAVRAFSALGVGVTAAATVLLVARHQRLLVATAAGFVTGIVPGLAWTALDGRSYAWSAAFAVLATLALENACRHRKRPRDWVLYGVVCLFACCWHLYLVLLIIGHGIAVMVGFPKGRVPWTLTAIGTAVVGVPLGLIAWSQRGQVSWLVDTNYPWEKMLLNQLTSGQSADPDWVRWVFLVGLLVFFVLGIRHLWKKGRRWLPSVLALWAGLPTVVAVVCAAVADGGMHPRYVTFAVPAYAIAATVGAFSLPKWTPAVAAVAGLAVVAPILVSQRAPDAKPDNLRAARSNRRGPGPRRGLLHRAEGPQHPRRLSRRLRGHRRPVRVCRPDADAVLCRQPGHLDDQADRRGRAPDPRLRHPPRTVRGPVAHSRVPLGAGHERPALRRHALHLSRAQPRGPMNESIIAPLPPVGP